MNPWLICLITVFIIALIKGILLCTYYYRCPKCLHLFKPKFYQIMFEAHFGDDFILKCPHCKTRGRKRVIVKDKKIIHQMNLHDTPFQLVENQQKTIEMRLNDEKRQLIQVGDQILFTNTKTNKQLICLVEEVFHYDNFEDLYQNHDKKELGYLEDEISDPSDMLEYYSKEQIEKYHVVGIKIRKLL